MCILFVGNCVYLKLHTHINILIVRDFPVLIFRNWVLSSSVRWGHNAGNNMNALFTVRYRSLYMGGFFFRWVTRVNHCRMCAYVSITFVSERVKHSYRVGAVNLWHRIPWCYYGTSLVTSATKISCPGLLEHKL